MGLGIESTTFLESLKALGVDFMRTAMIGRQNIHTGGYAEDYLRSLGASEVTSFDACDYEGAEHLHDFNYPIPREFHERYSVVLDGGTLEHIFNYPQALANCMNMVEVGGHLITITPTNNYSGHGFYQLSADVFKETFVTENGFKVMEMYACQSGTLCRCPPNGTGSETLLLVAARRIGSFPHQTKFPCQQGHTDMWKGHKIA